MLFVCLVLAALAFAAAFFAFRCARFAAAVEARAAVANATAAHRARHGADQAPGPELFHCRHCHQLIEATPDGWSVPYVDVATRSGACATSGPLTWHEPAIADRWLADVERSDLSPAEPTGIMPAVVVDDGRVRCIHDGRPIEPSVPVSGDVGHPWRHVDGGPACWWAGATYFPELQGKLATPDRGAIGARPPLSLIPAPVDVAAGGEL